MGLLFRLERGEATETATGGATSTEARDIRTATPGPPARLKVAPKGPVNTPSVQTGRAGLKEAPESQSTWQELSSAPVEATLPENQDASLGASKMQAAAEHQSGTHDDSRRSRCTGFISRCYWRQCGAVDCISPLSFEKTCFHTLESTRRFHQYDIPSHHTLVTFISIYSHFYSH